MPPARAPGTAQDRQRAGPPQRGGALRTRLVTEKFITACANGDVDALLAVLHPQVWGMAEFVAGSPIRPQVNHGADLVARSLIHFYGHGLTLVSHPPTVLAFSGRELFAVLTLTVEDDLITKLHATVDPFASG